MTTEHSGYKNTTAHLVPILRPSRSSSGQAVWFSLPRKLCYLPAGHPIIPFQALLPAHPRSRSFRPNACH